MYLGQQWRLGILCKCRPTNFPKFLIMLEMKHNDMADVTTCSKISFIAAKRLMNKSGEGPVKFPHFEIMHSVLKNTAVANPIHGR